MHLGDFRKMIRGWKRRDDYEKGKSLELKRLIRWVGYTTLVGVQKRKRSPEYWYPFVEDKSKFDKKYETDMRSFLGDIRKKYKRKGVTSG